MGSRSERLWVQGLRFGGSRLQGLRVVDFS